MTTIRNLGLAISALALMASPAFAKEARKGFYVGGQAGLTIPNDNEVTSKTGLLTHKLDFDPGWLAGANVGYAFGNGLRTELELGYREADKSGTTNPYGNTALRANGTYGLFNAMANLYYDMDINWILTPYVGVGIGYANLWNDGLTIASGAGTQVAATDGSAGALAYQAIGGFSYDICPRWQASLDYRYLGTDKVDFGNVKSEYSSHNIVLGLKYYFNAPKMAEVPEAAATAPAAGGPAAVPAVANTYMVFFDFDKAVLTPEAKNILARVAADYKKGKNVRVNVTGHADRSGKDSYNMNLSQKRAKAVQKELVRLGVQSQEIATVAKGESQPLVATADGVREAQNRRAEIVFGDAK